MHSPPSSRQTRSPVQLLTEGSVQHLFLEMHLELHSLAAAGMACAVQGSVRQGRARGQDGRVSLSALVAVWRMALGALLCGCVHRLCGSLAWHTQRASHRIACIA